jgi:hypothetical protein
MEEAAGCSEIFGFAQSRFVLFSAEKYPKNIRLEDALGFSGCFTALR